MTLIKSFEWRYATKKFDSTKKLSSEAVQSIIDASRLAPTSSGLQPFKLLVITNQELKEKIVSLSYGQTLPADCSHLLVFAAWDNYTNERIDHIYELTTNERNMPADRYNDYKVRLKTLFASKTAEQNFEHAARQAYIALGFAMAQAAAIEVDSTPMEGFSTDALDELLNLRAQGLRSVLMLPLGYRDVENDWLASLKKVRHPQSEFVVEIK
ncbi:MAG: NAD(P)H-dependent oxidoreductase [Porphyromonadaceae bacterium CG2_30_38_12]|nr:MAG: NAD(P)H-dependent oxidoreductase [Porphyromonadaceae bacterium CG2_30_38_12]